MRKQSIVVAAAVMIVFLAVFGAAAQGPGPQGAGADTAAKSTDSPHSYNPIKWVKKDSNTKTEKPNKAKNKKHSAKSAGPDTAAAPPNK
jgi:hypothetical protein